MLININRPYKECQAEDTIQHARNILGRLNLLPEESFFANPYPGIYSVSIQLADEKGGFRTNGKGRDQVFSLASAYAEFLERMQNGLYAVFSRTMINRLRQKFGFYYTPDERLLSKEEFLALPRSIIEDVVRYQGDNKKAFIEGYFQRLETNKIPGIVSVPFYDTKQNQAVHLPLNLMLLTVGSNGMAAGNTLPEALFQALCELLERWGAAEVFYHQLTPPSVPRDFLSQFEQEWTIIREIERSGKYRIVIKDFSAGHRIPALGIIVFKQETGEYRLNVGADTCFQVALSRCLTEVYQGMQNEEQFDQSLLTVPTEVPPYFAHSDEMSLFQRFTIFGEFTKDNSGVFPPSLFADSPDYAFDPSIFTTQDSYSKEVQVLINFFHQSGHNVYLRDVSFLGFPTVFIYVPGVSSQGRKNAPITSKENFFNLLELDKLEPLFFKLHQMKEKELRQIAQILSNFSPEIPIVNLFNIDLKAESWFKYLNVSFLLTQIWYRLSEFAQASHCFNAFLQTQGDTVLYYYQVCQRFLELKAAENAQEEIERILREEFEDQEQVQIVLEDFASPKQIFQFVQLPTCPNCRDCGLFDECLTRYKMDMSDTVYQQMVDNQISQEELAWVRDEQLV